MKKPIIIGVAGGTASGKTTVSQKILAAVGSDRLAYIEHDAYYHDLGHLPLSQRKNFNFDHPDALETDLLITHLTDLLANRSVEIPVYDFAAYARSSEVNWFSQSLRSCLQAFSSSRIKHCGI